MARFRLRLWLVVALALLGVAAARAQTIAWTAWLYNPNGTLTHVSSEGQLLQELTLPTVPGHSYPARVAVSRSGRLVAYVTANTGLKAHRLVLFDLNAAAVVGDHITTDLVGNSLDRFTTPLAFDETETRFAYGLAPQDGVWRVETLDVGTGAVAGTLRADDPQVMALGIATVVGRVPVIRAFQGGEIAFVMEQMGDPPGANYGSYLWNAQTGSLRVNNAYPGLYNDLLPATGEIITPAHDPALPGNDAAFAAFGGQHNALDVIEPSTRRQFPFYNSPERSLAAPRFIQNGERILTAALDPDGAVIWRVVERSGQMVGETAMQIADLFPLADGFIYLTTDNPSMLMVANTRAGIDAGTPVGQSAPNTRIQLAWAADAGPIPSPSFAAWVDLNDVVSVAQATQVALGAPPDLLLTIPGQTPSAQQDVPESPFYVAPTPSFLPTRETFQTRLQVGQRAVVTTAGNQAGLHVDPSINSPAIILLFTDMAVDVIDGPNITDGYIWWKVQAVSGGRARAGWAIEGANGETWLTPAA